MKLPATAEATPNSSHGARWATCRRVHPQRESGRSGPYGPGIPQGCRARPDGSARAGCGCRAPASRGTAGAGPCIGRRDGRVGLGWTDRRSCAGAVVWGPSVRILRRRPLVPLRYAARGSEVTGGLTSVGTGVGRCGAPLRFPTRGTVGSTSRPHAVVGSGWTRGRGPVGAVGELVRGLVLGTSFCSEISP